MSQPMLVQTTERGGVLDFRVVDVQGRIWWAIATPTFTFILSINGKAHHVITSQVSWADATRLVREYITHYNTVW